MFPRYGGAVTSAAQLLHHSSGKYMDNSEVDMALMLIVVASAGRILASQQTKDLVEESGGFLFLERGPITLPVSNYFATP